MAAWWSLIGPEKRRKQAWKDGRRPGFFFRGASTSRWPKSMHQDRVFFLDDPDQK